MMINLIASPCAQTNFGATFCAIFEGYSYIDVYRRRNAKWLINMKKKNSNYFVCAANWVMGHLSFVHSRKWHCGHRTDDWLSDFQYALQRLSSWKFAINCACVCLGAAAETCSHLSVGQMCVFCDARARKSNRHRHVDEWWQVADIVCHNKYKWILCDTRGYSLILKICSINLILSSVLTLIRFSKFAFGCSEWAKTATQWVLGRCMFSELK